MKKLTMALLACAALTAGCDKDKAADEGAGKESPKAEAEAKDKAPDLGKANDKLVTALEAIAKCKLENGAPGNDCEAKGKLDDLLDDNDKLYEAMPATAVHLMGHADKNTKLIGAWAVGEYASIVKDAKVAGALISLFEGAKDGEVRVSFAYAVSSIELKDDQICKKVAGHYLKYAKSAKDEGKAGEQAYDIASSLDSLLGRCPSAEGDLLTVTSGKDYPWQLREDAINELSRLTKGKKSQPFCDALSTLVDTHLERDSDFVPDIMNQAKHCPALVSKMLDTFAKGFADDKFGAAWLIYLSRGAENKDLTDEHKKKLRTVAETAKKAKDATDSEKKYADEILKKTS